MDFSVLCLFRKTAAANGADLIGIMGSDVVVNGFMEKLMAVRADEDRPVAFFQESIKDGPLRSKDFQFIANSFRELGKEDVKADEIRPEVDEHEFDRVLRKEHL